DPSVCIVYILQLIDERPPLIFKPGCHGYDIRHHLAGILIPDEWFEQIAVALLKPEPELLILLIFQRLYLFADIFEAGQHSDHFSAGSFCEDRKSTRLNSSHVSISYAVFCLKKKMNIQ